MQHQSILQNLREHTRTTSGTIFSADVRISDKQSDDFLLQSLAYL